MTHPAKPDTVVPHEWQPNERHRALCKQHDLDLTDEAERFRGLEHTPAVVGWDRKFEAWLQASQRQHAASGDTTHGSTEKGSRETSGENG